MVVPLTRRKNWIFALSLFFAAITGLAPTAQARISRVKITSNEPAYGGEVFWLEVRLRLRLRVQLCELTFNCKKSVVIARKENVEVRAYTSETTGELLFERELSKSDRHIECLR